VDSKYPTPLPCWWRENQKIYQIPLNVLIFQPTTIARFGRASLVKHFDGPYELIGGTVADCAAARKWCSLFAPEAVFSSVSIVANPVWIAFAMAV
jgi:hypothetical protein